MPIPNEEIGQFKKGQSGNPNGRPPKLLTGIVSELKAKGYERATSTTVLDAFEVLMNLPQSEIETLIADEDAPMSLRIVGGALLDAKGWDVLNGILDRAHGKAKQAVDLTTDGNPFPAPVIIRPPRGDKPEPETR